MISQLSFACIFFSAMALFTYQARKIIRNIRLGRPLQRKDAPFRRLTIMLQVAFGQRKMVKRPIAFVLHLLVYIGFLLVNIEMAEIIVDGLTGKHRSFSHLGTLYELFIGAMEYLALGVILACLLFLIRRNILHLKRFLGREMTAWPKTDANLILFAEIALMSALLCMNAAEWKSHQLQGTSEALPFAVISPWLAPILPPATSALILIARCCWWFHFVGVLIFLNYLPYSKHLHIILAFPNTYFSNLLPKGQFNHMESVRQEVTAILDPSYVPTIQEASMRFGAKDIPDLTWKNLLDAYTCTECGRCSSVCPAHITGKKLSPRKIMMDTRDRMEDIGKQLTRKKATGEDGKSLLDDYISREEIWACTTCNACVEACPVNINPLEIILELRRYVVMEESAAPAGLQSMMNNIENNAAPWKYPQIDRAKWCSS